MQLRNSAERYGAIAKALHWTIAALVIVAWVLGTVGRIATWGSPDRR